MGLIKQFLEKNKIKKVFRNMKEQGNILTEIIVENEIEISKRELENAKLINQSLVVNRLERLLDIKEREKIALKEGLNKFIDKSVIEKLIHNNVGGRNLVLINIEEYPRPIPSENAEIISLVQKLQLFDEILILYTDYSNETENIIKEKDPVAFGVFNFTKVGLLKNTSDRMYVITDWIDEFCDMNLEKMISELGLLGENTITLNE